MKNVSPNSPTEPHAGSIRQLILKVQGGEVDACQNLMARIQPVIQRAIRVHLSTQVRPLADTQDFAQMVWKSIFEHIDHLLSISSDEAVLAYLSRIAINKVLTTTRKAYAKKRGRQFLQSLDTDRLALTPSAESTPSERAIANEAYEQIIQGLDRPQARMVELRLEGYSQNEISRIMEVSERTVRRVFERISRKREVE